jgi:hypothetical protein
VSPGGGLNASDFVPGTALSGSVQFSNGGPDGRVVTLHTLRDGISEGVESFSVTLTGITPVSGGTVAFGTSQVGGSLGEGGRGTINGTPQADNLVGTPGNDVISALAGNDIVRGSAGSDSIDGGVGQDKVVYNLSRANLRVDKGDGTASIAKPDGTDRLVNVERIEFSGGRIVFDIESETRFEQRDGVPNYAYDEGYIYRLYDAAYARTPDEFGIRFWVDAWDRDDLSARELAIAFVESAEYQVRYPNASDADYIRQLYENALRRPAEPAGLSYWLDAFQGGTLDRADMLAYFAESTENRQRNAENTDDGLFFLASDSFDVGILV